jgi:hypothetical protein
MGQRGGKGRGGKHLIVAFAQRVVDLSFHLKYHAFNENQAEELLCRKTQVLEGTIKLS